jgi:hypothetical protein
MESIERIRHAKSPPRVLSALSAYIASLPRIAAIPEWCLRLPLKGADDVERRMTALVGVVNLTSQNLQDRDCSVAKDALRAFAAATWRLREGDALH